MATTDLIAVFKGRQKGDGLLLFNVSSKGILVLDRQVEQTAFLLPYVEESQVVVRLVVSRGKSYIQDIGFLGIGRKEVTLRLAAKEKSPEDLSSDVLALESQEHELFVFRRKALGNYVFGLLKEGHTVKIKAHGDESGFAMVNFSLYLPEVLSGNLIYSEALHESQGKDCYVGLLVPDDKTIPPVPCVIEKTFLRKHHIEALVEGYVLDVGAALDTYSRNVVVNTLRLPEYPEEFKAQLIDASVQESKNKTFLRALFSFHQGIHARVNIFQSMLNVISVEKPVSLPIKIRYRPHETFVFKFDNVAISKGHHAEVTPKIVEPYPSEFIVNVNGILVKSFLSREKWEERERKEEDNRCRLPEFEIGKSYILPVNMKLYEKSGVKFFLSDAGADKIVEGVFKYHGLRSVLKFIYCEFSLPPSEVRYQVLLTEFLLHGIGGFETGAQIKMLLVKSSKDKENVRGSYINKWLLQSLDIAYPDISTLDEEEPVTAKSMFDWTLFSDVRPFDVGQWSLFAKQRKNFAHLAITGFGPVLPALSVPPFLMRNNNVYHLKPGEDIQAWVRKQSVDTSTKSLLENAQWLSALKVSEREQKEKPRANIKRLKCIGFEKVRGFVLLLEDEKGNKTTYNKFKESNYPLAEHQLAHHVHVARCKADGEVIEILEIVNNEA